MRFIPTRIHGMLDYLMGALLIAAPWIFDFNRDGAETWVPVILGAGVIMYSLFTDYELGAVRKLSMGTHLMLDLLGGILLAASPWLFGFSDFVYLPHLILGIAEIGAALLTEREPATYAHSSHRTGSNMATTDSGRSTATTVNTDSDATITSHNDRPPMGSNPDTRTRTESERSRREGRNME